MMLMCCNHSSPLWHYLAGKYPGRLGWLQSPSAWKTPKPWLPYALDNDAYQCWVKKTEWNESKWLAMLQSAKLTRQHPLWLIVPDVVCNAKATLEQWEVYSPIARKFGWPLAFAVQDGMQSSDVPKTADVVFVGGSTKWKWRTLPQWCRDFPRVHVGRVNEIRRLWTCEDYKVESVDGTGWFKKTDDGPQARQLIQWIEGQRSEIYDHKELNL